MKLLSLGFLSLFCTLASAQDATQTVAPAPLADASALPASVRGKLEIWLLVGQSNMAGHGKLADSTSQPDPRVWMLGNDYRWKIAADPLDDFQGQVDEVTKDTVAGVGPGMAFALELVKRDPTRFIALVPCAKGGRPLQFFLKPANFDPQNALQGRNSAYGSLLYRARQAETVGHLAGILFFQGEGDANAASVPAALGPRWGEEFSAWVASVRADLGQPNLPVLFAQLGTMTGKAAQRYVRVAQVKASQAAVTLPGVAMITTDDLPTQDGVHFTSPAYEEIGRRFAAAEQKLQLSAAPNPGVQKP